MHAWFICLYGETEMIKNVVEYLNQSANEYPQKKAFCYGECFVSFEELRRRARIVATQIVKKKFFRQPVIVMMENKVNAITAFMAAAYSGNFYVPIDTDMPAGRLQRILETFTSLIVITDDIDDGNLYKLIDKAGGDRNQVYNLNELLEGETDEDAVDRATEKQIDTDLLYILFTSGSTGTPKGVCVSHRAVIDYTEWYSDTFHIDQNIIYGAQAPLFFDMSISELYSTIRNGCTTIYIPKRLFMSPSKLIDFLNQNEINVIFWVPFPLCVIADLGLLEKKKLPYLRKVLFAGEAMPNKQLNKWRREMPDILYANCFGPTEIANIFAYYIVDRDFDDNESLPIGIPCRNIDIMLLDENRKQINEKGVIGEISIRGTCLSAGYYGLPQLTDEVFIQNPTHNNFRDPVYLTGDLGFYNERNELCGAGRKNYQIKYKGYRIELGEIERAACEQAGVLSAVALYDEKASKISLFVTPNSIKEQELYEFLKEKVPHYMLPHCIIPLDTFPVNANGKIDRKKLKEQS